MNNNQNNYTDHYMIPFEQAFKLINNETEVLSNESVLVSQARGRVLAEDIFSPLSVPPFNNSAMDGYAVNIKELEGATNERPIRLRVVGLTAAGDSPAKIENSELSAWKIMTGAPVPPSYNAIIPVEDTCPVTNEEAVLCFSQPNLNAHIRASGEDFSRGDLVLSKNTLISSNMIMALASLGVSKVSVKVKPKIAIFSTGKELVDDPEQALEPGQIYNSNMAYILEFLNDLPVNAYNAGTNYDDVESYEKAIQQQLDNSINIIISTGAVSMGDFDFIPQTILKMGGKIIFHKIKIRPGKPILFARFPNGSYYFGLPGNPISATIGLRFFVSHLITQLLLLSAEKPIKTEISSSLSKKKNFTNILKAHASIDSSAKHITEILNGQESFKINPLIDANGWIVLSSERESVAAGELVDFYPSTHL